MKLNTTWDVLRRVLIETRLARGWSLSEVARRSGISKTTLHDLETGNRHPRVDTLIAYAHALGRPLALIDTTEETTHD